MNYNYTKKEIKHNILVLYLTCIIGIAVGLDSFSTNMQAFFYKTVGEDIVLFLDGFYYATNAIIFLFSFYFMKTRYKKIIITLEIIIYSLYGSIAVYLLSSYINKWVIMINFMCIIFIEQILIFAWSDFQLRLVPENERKKYYGNMYFLFTTFTIIGMLISKIILKLEYPKNYIILFTSIFVMGVISVTTYFFIIEKKEVDMSQTPKRITIKESILLFKEMIKNKWFIILIINKVFANLGSGVALIYALLALKNGYTAQDVATMGLIYYIAYAISGLIFGSVKLLYSQILTVSRVILIISYVYLYFDRNFYIAYVILGLASCGIEIANINLLGYIGDEQKSIYIAFFKILEVFIAISIYVFGKIEQSFGLEIALIISVILLLIAQPFSMYLKRMEKEKTGIQIN